MGINYTGIFAYGARLPRDEWDPFIEAVYQTEGIDYRPCGLDSINEEQQKVNQLWAERKQPVRMVVFGDDYDTGVLVAVEALMHELSVWKSGVDTTDFLLPALDTSPWDQLLHRACQEHGLHPVRPSKGFPVFHKLPAQSPTGFRFAVSPSGASICYGMKIEGLGIPSELDYELIESVIEIPPDVPRLPHEPYPGVISRGELLVVAASLKYAPPTKMIDFSLPAMESWLKGRQRLIEASFHRYNRPPHKPHFYLIFLIN